MISHDQKITIVQKAYSRLKEHENACFLCPRECGVNRSNGQLGFCLLPNNIKMYKYKIHFGEEPPISGKNGSGIIFFAGCTMQCAYCQNYPMSFKKQGFSVSADQLARIILQLQEQGAHNINLVTASHFLPEILLGLKTAYEKGLTLPIVYNTNGYESIEVLRLLEGIIDIYLPDLKYSENVFAKSYSKCANYVKHSQEAVTEMFRQVGLLQTDEHGIAQKGIIIRHLILPNDRAGTNSILDFIANKLDQNIFMSIMTQYLPIWNAYKYPEIDRGINFREVLEAVNLLEKYDIKNGWVQDLDRF